MRSLGTIDDHAPGGIAELLAEGDRPLGERLEEFEVDAPALSQSLDVPREAGLATARAEGWARILRRLRVSQPAPGSSLLLESVRSPALRRLASSAITPASPRVSRLSTLAPGSAIHTSRSVTITL